MKKIKITYRIYKSTEGRMKTILKKRRHGRERKEEEEALMKIQAKKN